MKLIRLVWCEMSLVNPHCILSYFLIKPVTVLSQSFEVCFRAWNITEIILTGLLVARHVFIFCLYIGNVCSHSLGRLLKCLCFRATDFIRYYSSDTRSTSSVALRHYFHLKSTTRSCLCVQLIFFLIMICFGVTLVLSLP